MYSSGRSVNDWLPLFFMLLFHSLHLHQLFYNSPRITSKFKNRFFSARNTRVLEIFCNALCFNPLPLLIEIPVLFDVNVCCNLRQVILQSASSYPVICVKLRCVLHQVAWQSELGYTSGYLTLSNHVCFLIFCFCR